MTTYLGKSCSFGLPQVPFVNCRQFMYLVISLLVLRAGCGICLYQFLIIVCLFTFQQNQRKRKNLGLMMIVKHLFRNENKLCDNLMLVLYTKIWKTSVFFVRKPAARLENQNVNPGNNMFPD